MERTDRFHVAWTSRKTSAVFGCLLASLTSCIAPPDATDDENVRAPVRAQASQAPAVDRTRPLAVVAGSTRANAAPFYGTDLGWTFAHAGDLWMMFGDTWSDWLGTSIQPDADDALGKISLKDFPNGDMVELWIALHPAPLGAPRWQAAAPPLKITLDISGVPSPIRPVRDGMPLTSGPGLTPMAGFSNAREGDAAGAFGLFLRNEPVQCDAAGSCDDGFDCDRDLGVCAPIDGELSPTCVLGTSSCWCIRIATGFCQDRSSSVYDARSERGRSHSVVMRQLVGNAVHGDETHFVSQPWDTRRFFNATARTVNDFDPSRPHGIRNNYLPADGLAPEREGVLVWGRPNFGGVRSEGRDAQVYLAWVPMPEYDENGSFAWNPRYFAGLEPDGRPRFVARAVEAKSLDLDATVEGDQPEEKHDLVGQMSIAWVPGLRRFVMLYGGGIGSDFTYKIFGPDAEQMQLDPLGSIHIRYAEQPWGPWTPPEPLVISGNPSRGVTGYYGPGGLLHHGDCKQTGCAPGEFAFLGPTEPGRLYAPNIIDSWTMERPDGAIDLYWNVSTWNPYQVVLMKTRLGGPAPAL